MKRIASTLLFVCAVVVRTNAQPVIRWEPFELKDAPAGVRAELGKMSVPLVRGEASSGNAEIAFVRLRADRAANTAAPIVYLPGGPGGSGIAVTRDPRALVAFASLATAADVILLDARGIGLSTPRPVCAAPRPLEPHERLGDPDRTLPLFIDGARRCVAEWKAKGVDVRGFTNRESAADLEDLRRGLGVEKISLFGFSYGAHLALATLHYFPKSIERMVLVGTEGPNHTRKLPLTLDVQLAKLSLLSGVDMNAALRRISKKLAAKPIVVEVTDRAAKKTVNVPIDVAALQRILTADIGDGNDFTVFPALLSTLEAGDTSILAWFVDKRFNAVTGRINLMVLGLECSSAATAERQREIERQSAVSLFGNAMNFPFPDVCAALPNVDLGDAFRQPVASDVATLFVSGTLDSNTPPQQAEEVRWGMPNATHLIVENAGHEDTLGMPEVQRAISDFFAGRDVRGRAASMPRPKFLSIEEAKAQRSTR